jgi:hypothetical protein
MGDKDELGAANLITPAKWKQALALPTEGLPVSLAHDVPREPAADAPNILDHALGPVRDLSMRWISSGGPVSLSSLSRVIARLMFFGIFV